MFSSIVKQFSQKTEIFTALFLVAIASSPSLANTLTKDAVLQSYTTSPWDRIEAVGKTNAVEFLEPFEEGSYFVLGGIGKLDDGEMAGLELEVYGTGVLVFDWFVSSEDNWDVLRVYEVGGTVTNEISGTEASWTQTALRTPPDIETNHIFRIEYVKDPFGDYVGEDCGKTAGIHWALYNHLDVINGTGSGTYYAEETVSIISDPPPVGHKFDCWESEYLSLLDLDDPSLDFYMPDSNIVVTATYAEAQSYQLTVISGNGSGVYTEGNQVTINANPAPLYMDFAGWDDSMSLTDPSNPNASLVMPEYDLVLTATYTTNLSRVAGCYGRDFFISGIQEGISADFGSDTPSGTPSVKLGGPGVVPDNDYTGFKTLVMGEGTISFNWRVSSQANYDFLRFLVDGVEVASLSGTKGPWTPFSYSVSGVGSHYLKWEYRKDASLSSSQDAGWVDDIVWVGDNPHALFEPRIIETFLSDDTFSFKFLGERGIPYVVCKKVRLTDFFWDPVGTFHYEEAETNGLFRFAVEIQKNHEQQSCFFKIVSSMEAIGYQSIDVNPESAIHTSYGTFTVLEVYPESGYTFTWQLSDPSLGSLSPTTGNKTTYFTTSIPTEGSAVQVITVIGTNPNSTTVYRGSSRITHRAP